MFHQLFVPKVCEGVPDPGGTEDLPNLHSQVT